MGLGSVPTIAMRLASVLGLIQGFPLRKGPGHSPEGFQRWTQSVRGVPVYNVSFLALPPEMPLGEMIRHHNLQETRSASVHWL